jgi:tripartite-type tricarboxylate transporter receptor subunit TctC
VPTIGESGLQGYETSNWYGFLAPARTPKPIIDRLHNEIVKILATPDVKEKLAAQGAEVIANTPQEFADNIKTDVEKWRRVVKETGAKVE